MYKVLISDKFAEEGIDILKNHAEFEVDVKTGLNPDELKAIISDYDALLVRSATKPNADILAKADNLKLIVRAGAGTDNIDKKFAAEKNIVVENTPGQNSHAVAELTIGLMLSLARHIHKAHASTKAGKWEKKLFKGSEIKGKTLGLIGVGKIGKDVGQMAEALGMKVIAHDVLEGDLGFQRVTLDELLQNSDYISLHIPLNDATKNMFDANMLSKMKKSAYLLNCARGAIVDEAALANAVENGIIAGAAVDGYSEEPATSENPVVKCEGILTMPHIGAATKEAQINCAVAAAEQTIEFFVNKNTLHQVN